MPSSYPRPIRGVVTILYRAGRFADHVYDNASNVAAVGAPELPLGAPVEVELIAEIEP